jgi:hypothetical protein
MPQTTTLVPLNHPDTGEPIAIGSKITMSDEAYAAARAAGQVEASEAEQKAGQLEASPEGVYNARTGREDVASTKTAEETPKKK